MTDQVTNTRRVSPFTVGLVTVGALALLGAFVLAAGAAQESRSYSMVRDDAAVVTMGAWADVLLVLGAVALVGGLVLAGVRWVLRQAGLDV